LPPGVRRAFYPILKNTLAKPLVYTTCKRASLLMES